MYKWDSAGTVLRYQPAKGEGYTYIVAIIMTEVKCVNMWRGLESQNAIKIPYPEGMEFGPELRKYVVMQHKLMK